ncbi:cation:proton antiporter [Hydromonas duriensis]|uniref:Sodium/proton antiporter (CPA1 family) n=1 Tax=Hydromonas duriensis TaxID=1527608 RepID=A0A4R6Y9R3_9BURK|nr:cation:proton antiporter [Hydromonas duriensis]TDR32187.1 sodium/proton antiporter (CPA1 family) [Hydromonas duriensis]
MSTVTIAIAICALLTLAYVFDLTASKTKIPSVILLLLLGWLVARVPMERPDLSFMLPILGTMGLILIVLEGSLELQINRSKIPLVKKSSLAALLPMLILPLGAAYLATLFGYPSLKNNMVNFVPLFIISSAIAIPTAQSLNPYNREFVIYESSLSDIFGVMLFNFIALNEVIDGSASIEFVKQTFVMLAISLVATLALAWLISSIKHHVKFVPIVLATVMIYLVSKHYHLPSLLFILLFGLFLGNVSLFKNKPKFNFLHPEVLGEEVHRLKDIVAEVAFLVRSLFFLFFGFLLDTNELLNTDTILLAILITSAIFGSRALVLKLFKMPKMPLMTIAPRGLITILLFLSIPPEQSIALVNKPLITQVIILTALVMMFGVMFNKTPVEEPEPNNEKVA